MYTPLILLLSAVLLLLLVVIILQTMKGTKISQNLRYRDYNERLNNKTEDFLRTHRVFDCFMASGGEEDLLILRLKMGYPYVSKFVIMDSRESHRGHKKKLIDFDKIPDNLRGKIIYENVKFPKEMQIHKLTKYDDKIAWARENYQRDRIHFHLKKNSKSDDLCFVSDLDEIPLYAPLLNTLVERKLSKKIVHFNTHTYVYNIHYLQKNYQPATAFITPFSEWQNTATFMRTKMKRRVEISLLVIHLNRFRSPLGLFTKESHIVESSIGEGKSPYEITKDTEVVDASKLRDYLKRVCLGLWEDDIVTVNHNIPLVVYKILHPIHTMSVDKLRNIYTQTNELTDEDLVVFVNSFFSSSIKV